MIMFGYDDDEPADYTLHVDGYGCGCADDDHGDDANAFVICLQACTRAGDDVATVSPLRCDDASLLLQVSVSSALIFLLLSVSFSAE